MTRSDRPLHSLVGSAVHPSEAGACDPHPYPVAETAVTPGSHRRGRNAGAPWNFLTMRRNDDAHSPTAPQTRRTRSRTTAIVQRGALAALAIWALVGCNKPSSEDCEKALHNIQRILQTDNLGTTEILQGEIRRCRGSSSKKAVACTIEAKTAAELNACDFARKK